MTGMDIVEFLTRCLDEDQARAELAQQVIAGSWDCWEVVAQQLHACCDTVPMIGRVGQFLQVNADPARVLAGIAAKRKRLALHQRHDPNRIEAQCMSTEPWCEFCSYFDYDGDEERTHVEIWPCLHLRIDAEPYADRPGFDPSWRLEA